MLKSILDHICVVFGALLFLQLPLFIQQYQQHLSGRVAELQWQIESMRQAATQSGKTLDQYVEKFESFPDNDIRQQGEVMQTVVTRWERLTKGLNALEKASVVTRPFAFVYYLQKDVMVSTLQAFSLGIPLTFEGVVYALFGMLVGYFFFVLLSRLCSNLFARYRTSSS